MIRALPGAGAGILLAGLTGAVGATSPPVPALEPRLERQIQHVMGTSLELAVLHADSTVARAALAAAFAETRRLEKLLSNYDPESALSRVVTRAGAPVEASDDLIAYLKRAQADTRRTDGAFDVTVGPLLKIHRSPRPNAARIDRALGLVGATKMSFPEPGLVFLPSGMVLDPGGDGKGVAVDAMLAIFADHGIEDAFVNFGGSSLAGLGSRPGEGDGWPVAIRGPEDAVVATVLLRNRCASTSTALPPPEDPQAPRQGHVVDPRTGELVEVLRTTVVISPSATDAEVLSTALVVEGAAGFRWLDRFEEAVAAVYEPAGAKHSAGYETVLAPAE